MKLGQRHDARGLARVAHSLRQGRLAHYVDRVVSLGSDPRRTLVVSGFWRSGTTWLQESLAQVLGAKTVFEPFHLEVPGARALLLRKQPVAKADPFLELHMLYCGGLELEGDLRSAFARALRSAVPGRGTRLLRTNARECFRRRIVVKLVRGHLFLRAAQQSFGMPIIHVCRDPRGVVASVKQAGWGWLFDHLRLAEQLLEPQDGRAEAFAPWRDAIEEYDRMDKVARLAAYWAITERFLRDSLQASGGAPGGRCVFVSYEELCQKREHLLVDMMVRLGLEPAAPGRGAVLDQDSLSTSESRLAASLEDRIIGWKKQLSAAEIALINKIAGRFGLEDRLFDGQPAQGRQGRASPVEQGAAP